MATVRPRSLLARLRRALERRAVSPVARTAKDRNLTYLSWASLRQLEAAIRRAAEAEGDFIECGIALGGSALAIRALMPSDRQFHGYDTFGMIPDPASPKDDHRSKERYATIAAGQSAGLGGDTYYGYLDDLYDRVSEHFRELGLADRTHLHKGLFEETLNLDWPVAFAHLDCDWYDSVSLCLTRIYPRLSHGGRIVCDDYHHYGGARQAVDEFLAVHRDVTVEAAGGRESTNLTLVKR